LSRTPSDGLEHLDYADRIFHVELFRGGMNRLLLRSNRSESWRTRLEVFFMYVQYMALPMRLHGPIIHRLGTVEDYRDAVPSQFEIDPDLLVFSVRSQAFEGVIVAGAMALDESELSASAPSNFFMME
jgi:hypothetical protein